MTPESSLIPVPLVSTGSDLFYENYKCDTYYQYNPNTVSGSIRVLMDGSVNQEILLSGKNASLTRYMTVSVTVKSQKKTEVSSGGATKFSVTTSGYYKNYSNSSAVYTGPTMYSNATTVGGTNYYYTDTKGVLVKGTLPGSTITLSCEGLTSRSFVPTTVSSSGDAGTVEFIFK